jgi:hypothetical protein
VLGLLHLIRADTVLAYQRIRLFVWANSMKTVVFARFSSIRHRRTSSYQLVSSRISCDDDDDDDECVRVARARKLLDRSLDYYDITRRDAGR